MHPINSTNVKQAFCLVPLRSYLLNAFLTAAQVKGAFN